LTALKKEQCPWLSEAVASCHTQKLIDQDKAFKNFFAGRAKYPRFKKRHQAQSVRYQLDQRHVEKNFNAEDKLLKLPKLGAFKLKWSRKMEGVPKMAAVSRDPAGHYFVSMACEVEMTALPTRKNAVGVDVGVKDVVVTSNGWKSGAGKYTYRYARQLKLSQRRLASKKKGSNRRRKQQHRVARIHARIADSRMDFLHQISSKLINENQVICLEDLNIKGMLRNRHLSKAVADSGLFELRRQLEYKSQWYGRDVFVVDRWAPTSKTCSGCGTYQPQMPLKIREWACPDCGEHHDRDINAAKNILFFGTAGSAGTYKARGAVKTPRAAA
jgi:putative transposase